MGANLRKSQIAEDLPFLWENSLGDLEGELGYISSIWGKFSQPAQGYWGKCGYDESNCSASYVKAQL